MDAVWNLNSEDFLEISNLYEKKIALENLVLILSDNPPLLERAKNERATVQESFSNWWDEKREAYNWPVGRLSVDFDKKQILLWD